MKKPIVALVAVLSAALAIAAMDAAKIQWKPKAGDTYKTKLTAKSNVQGPTGPVELSFGAVVATKVTEIKADGNIVVEETQSDISIRMGDQDFSSMAPQNVKTTTVMSPTGEVVSRKSESEQSSERLDSSFEFVFPAKDMNVGDTWKTRRAADSAKGTFAREFTFTYDGTEKIGSWDCNRIKVSFKETDAPTNMTYEGTIWLNAADGSQVKGSYKIKNAVFTPEMPPADATIETSRIE